MKIAMKLLASLLYTLIFWVLYYITFMEFTEVDYGELKLVHLIPGFIMWVGALFYIPFLNKLPE